MRTFKMPSVVKFIIEIYLLNIIVEKAVETVHILILLFYGTTKNQFTPFSGKY